jgi:hypothetical protein
VLAFPRYSLPFASKSLTLLIVVDVDLLWSNKKVRVLLDQQLNNHFTWLLLDAVELGRKAYGLAPPETKGAVCPMQGRSNDYRAVNMRAWPVALLVIDTRLDACLCEPQAIRLSSR